MKRVSSGVSIRVVACEFELSDGGPESFREMPGYFERLQSECFMSGALREEIFIVGGLGEEVEG